MSESVDATVQRKAAESWTIDFSSTADSTTQRKTTRKEVAAMSRLSRATPTTPVATAGDNNSSSSPAVVVVALSEVPLNPSDFIPTNLTTSREDLLQRLHLDVPKLLCVAKQYPRSCGITSLTSVWNALYSCIGHGTLPPVSQEEVMSILGFEPPFDTIRWGPFTGNTTLFRWFHALNRHFGVKGKAYYLYKVHGQGRTVGVEEGEAKERVKAALRSPHAGLIYHCHNHYMVPVGFQCIPRLQSDCYQANIKEEDTEMTLYIGEVSRGKHPAMHTVKWRDVVTDLSTILPEYVNIRQAHLGVQTRKKKKSVDEAAVPSPVTEGTAAVSADVGGDVSTPPPSPLTTTDGAAARNFKTANLHCLLCFRSDIVEEDLAQFENTDPSAIERRDEEEEDDD